jgi:membrane protein
VFLPIFLNLLGFGSWSERLIAAARWPLLLIAAIAALALVYRYGPSRRIAKWRWVSGSVTAAVLWLAMSMLFSWYVVSAIILTAARTRGKRAKHRHAWPPPDVTP